MKPVFRTMFVALLVATALSAIASASASAAKCVEEKTNRFALCVGKERESVESGTKYTVHRKAGGEQVLKVGATITLPARKPKKQKLNY